MQDLDYFGSASGSRNVICGYTAWAVVKNYRSFINSAYFIAMVAELKYFESFLVRYFPEYSLNIPISPDPNCFSAHGGIFNVDSMLSYFENDILDSQYMTNSSQMSEFRMLLVNEYIHDLSVKRVEDDDFDIVGEPLLVSTYEVSEAIIAGYLHNTQNKAFLTFLKFKERYNNTITTLRENAIEAKRLSVEKENKIKSDAKNSRVIRATENLYNAIRRGDERAVKALLIHGADVNTSTPNGEHLIDFARRKGNSEIIGLLKHSN